MGSDDGGNKREGGDDPVHPPVHHALQKHAKGAFAVGLFVSAEGNRNMKQLSKIK